VGGQLVRDLDINPNKPHYFVSAGDDYKIKFWDQRNLTKPLQKVFSRHSHWVWKVQYNPSFDALVISASSDGTVNLWNVSSLSFQNPSAVIFTPTTTTTSTTTTTGTVATTSTTTTTPTSPNIASDLGVDSNLDRLIKTYEDHEDSVYSICWSKCSDRPWDWASFASLSYDGRVVINRVPEKEARKVLGA